MRDRAAITMSFSSAGYEVERFEISIDLSGIESVGHRRRLADAMADAVRANLVGELTGETPKDPGMRDRKAVRDEVR